MKKLILLPALAALLLTSCKDDPTMEAPEISSINFSKERVAVGQLVTITPTVTDRDTDVSNLIYKWMITDGFSSSEREAKWVPNETGNQVITLTVDDLNTKITQDATIEVIEPDFRRGLWNDKQTDIEKSEKHAGNEQLIEPTEGILAYPGDEPIAADVYYFTNDKLDQTATFYFPEHPETELNRYITDYETRKTNLITSYGQPLREITEWENEEAEANYTSEQWAQAIAAGDLVIASVWQKTANTNMVLILQSDDDGGILLILFYFPVEDGGRYTSPLQKGTDTFKIEKHAEAIQKIRMLMK